MAFNACPCKADEPSECSQGAVYLNVCCGGKVLTCGAITLATSYVCAPDTIAPTACILWTGGAIAGTGDDGSVWSVTLAAGNDCDGDQFGRRVDVASVAFGGRTITWTWDSGRSAYDVSLSGFEDCETECPVLSISLTWAARLWTSSTRPDTIDVTISGFGTAPGQPETCCSSLNGTKTLEFYSASDASVCGLYDRWEYLYEEEFDVGDLGFCCTLVQLTVDTLDGCCVGVSVVVAFGRSSFSGCGLLANSCNWDFGTEEICDDVCGEIESAPEWNEGGNGSNCCASPIDPDPGCCTVGSVSLTIPT